MDNIWTIIGFAGTLIFGIASIILGVKALRKNKIEHFFINSYEVGKGLMNEFPKFKLSYDDKEIENNFTVLKGGFINTGKDIKTDDIEFDMILPKSCRILDVVVKSSDDNLNVIPTCNENKLHYKIDKQLLNNDLFFYSAIVVSTEEIEKIGDKLSFYHRISNTKKIKDTDLELYKPKHDIYVRLNTPLLGLLTAVILFVICIYTNSNTFVKVFGGLITICLVLSSIWLGFTEISDYRMYNKISKNIQN